MDMQCRDNHTFKPHIGTVCSPCSDVIVDLPAPFAGDGSQLLTPPPTTIPSAIAMFLCRLHPATVIDVVSGKKLIAPFCVYLLNAIMKLLSY